jgi:predicted ATPase/class 3 adenylate cyclase
MRHLVPSFILDHYRAGTLRGTLPAAGMFMDLSGFSAMADSQMQHGQRGAEVLAGVIRDVFEPLVQSVYVQGGFIVGYAGDAFTAVFPEQTGGHPAVRRALKAAQAIQAQMGLHPVRETPFGQYAISAKIGLARGEAAWEIFQAGDGGRATFCFRGPAVEDAAQAEHHAIPGEIVCDDGFLAALGPGFHVEPTGDYHRVTGGEVTVSMPRPVYQVPLDPVLLRTFFPEGVDRLPDYGEFRPVVNVFVDIPQTPDEAGLQAFMQAVFELQARYEGYFLRPDFGDKGSNLVLFWGAPVARENDVERALNFLLDLFARVDFPLTAGVTYRMAHAGFIGADLRQDYTCYGWGVNLAARLMQSAAPGQIWMDEEVARRAGRLFEVQSAGERTFKGFAQQQAVYMLGARRGKTDPARQGRFLGRADELARLANFLAPIWDGKLAGALLVRGEAGIGKTRLIDEFRAGHPARWLVCPANEILRQSFNPFAYFLREELDASGAQGDLQEHFDAWLEGLAASCPDPGLAAELRRTSSCLAALVNLRQDGSLYEQLDARGRYENTFIALASLVKAEALRKPTVLFLEDSQWLDEDSRAFLPYLVRSLTAESGRAYPLALLGTSRPESPGLGIEDQAILVERFDLGGLQRAELADLATLVLAGPACPSLLNLLEARAEGNPFYAEQILRYLQEQELLTQDADGYACVEAAPGESIPTDVRAVLTSRLDRLTHDVRETVQTAAVLGREFEVRLLLAMLREDGDESPRVRMAEQAEIWYPLNEIRYIFRHALMRDAAYSMQLLSRLRGLHALAVEAMETLYSADLAPHYGELAHHAEQARLEEKARNYLTLAGRQAADAYQNRPAIDYYTRALALAPEDDAAGRFELVLAREKVLNRIGDRDAQLEDLKILDVTSKKLDGEIYALKTRVEEAFYAFNVGDYPEAVRLAVELEKYHGRDDLANASLEIYSIWALSLLRTGRWDEAVLWGNAGLSLVRRLNNRREEGQLMNVVGQIHLDGNEAEKAMNYFEQALRIARENRDYILEAIVLNNLGNSTGIYLRDYAAAGDYYQRCLDISHERGDRLNEGLALGNLGWVRGMMGDFPFAKNCQEQALSIAREVGNRYQEAYILINLSAVATILGENDAAEQAAVQGIELAQVIGDRAGEAWARLYAGYAMLSKGKNQPACDAFSLSQSIFKELNQPALAIEVGAGLVFAALERQDLPAARVTTDEILSYLSSGGTLDGTEEPLRVYLACYRTLQRLGDARAPDVLRQAGDTLEKLLAVFNDGLIRDNYVDSVPWRRAIRDACREG